MSDMKMSEVFPEAFQVEHNKSFEVQDAAWYSYGEKYESDGDQDSAIEHAVLNHDRLVEENKQQRESLDAFRELVKAQTQTMNDLNEKCKELAGDNADLVKHLENLVDESIYLAQFKNKTLRGNIRSTDLDEPEWHDYQTIGEAVAFLEKLKVSK